MIFRAENYDFRNGNITSRPRNPSPCNLETVLELMEKKIPGYLVLCGFDLVSRKDVVFGRFWHFSHFLAYECRIPTFHPLSHF